MRITPGTLLWLATTLTVVGGCSSSELVHIAEEERREYLPFLEPGETTRGDVLLILGRPGLEFDGDRVATYRMVFDQNKRLVIAPREGLRGWGTARYSLVLVFGEDGILEEARLHRVKAGD